MTVSPFQLEVPDTLLAKLRRRADESRRSVEEEAVSILEDATYDSMLDELEGLELLDDEALFSTARKGMPADASEELENLHFKMQREGLSRLERDREEELVARFERAMMFRAKAAAILHGRGRDVSILLQP